MPTGSKIAYNEVSTVLWRERELLEGLAFALEMQRLVLLPGNDRWVPRVCREVELSLDRLRPVQLGRAMAVDNLARELGLDPSPTLQAIIDAVAEPWTEIFTLHRRGFLELTDEIVALAENNRLWLGKNRASFVAASGWLSTRTPGDTGNGIAPPRGGEGR